MDQLSQTGVVLIGLSPTLESLVAAYLLKIQKYDLLAVTIVGPVNSGFHCSVDEESIKLLKKFCDYLQIPFQLIYLQDEYQEVVMNHWTAKRIEGIYEDRCHNCRQWRIKVLYEVMKKNGLKNMATGHYAKLTKNPVDHKVVISGSGDFENDQSSDLLGLPHEILNSLELPLGELQKKDVIKLAENFSLDHQSFSKEKNCFNMTDDEKQKWSKSIPHAYHKEGVIMTSDDRNVSAHHGVFNYQLGDKFDGQEQYQRDEHEWMINKIDLVSATIFLKDKKDVKPKKLLLKCLGTSEKMDYSRAIKGYLREPKTKQEVEVIFYFKPFNYIEVDIISSDSIYLFSGQVLTIYKKRGSSSLVYLKGKVVSIFEHSLPAEESKDAKKAHSSFCF